MTTALQKKAFDPALPAVQKAIDALEIAMGGREALIDTLSTGHDPDTDYLLGLIADPRNDKKSLSVLCDEGNITPGQLLRLYRDARIAKAQVLALDAVARDLPAVAADVTRRAQNHYILCTHCKGTKEVWEDIKDGEGRKVDRRKSLCPGCDGTGQVLAEASLDHQKLTLDLAGLLSKGSGPTVNVLQANTAAGPVATGLLPFAELQLAVQKALAPHATVEIVEADPPAESPQ
jgi:hypothetical protein